MKVIRMRKTDLKTRHGLVPHRERHQRAERYAQADLGGETPVRLTINGFRNLPLLVDKISAKLDFPRDSLWSALSDTEFMASFGVTPRTGHGHFS